MRVLPFLVFCNANFHVFLGGWFFFSKKDTSISWRCPNFAKNGCANLLDFLANRQTSGRRRADVGQTSGTSGTERRANVGQMSGTSGELKVVETGKNHLQWNRGGKIDKKGTCPVMPKIL